MNPRFLYALLALCLIVFNVEAQDGQIFSYGPDGKNQFVQAEDKILIRFDESISFAEKVAILDGFKEVTPLKKEDVLPAPDVTIAKVNGLSSGELERLIKQLNELSTIEYANPFLVFKDGTYQGIQDRIIVRLKSSKDLGMMNSVAKDLNLNVLERNEFDPLIYVLQTTKQSSGNALQMANRLHESGAFEYTEPDFLLLLKRMNTNDGLLDYQWSLNNTGSSIQYNGTPGADMNVFPAWATTTGSSSIKVAIIDEGVDLNHPDLVGNMLGGYDATGQGSGGGPQGDDAHGTACAGIVAAVGNNNLGVAGVAYNAKIIPVRIAYSNAQGNWVTTNTWIGNALNWSWQTAGADILSNSWGGGGSSSTINNAINGAVNNGRGGLGAPVLFAAGNDNGANSYPATVSNTISVIAMSMCYERKSPSSCDGETWWGSNYGSGADIAAPGVKIATTDISGSAGYVSGDYTGTFNGTSSATPNAAGVMALILSANSNLTEAQARYALESTCRKVGGYNYNGGVSGQPNGTWSNDLGYGLVDAYQAVLSVSPQVADDAGISSISSPSGTICATSATPSLTLNNFGNNTLNSVAINYQLDGGSVSTYNWSGTLASGSSTTVNLPSISFSGGSHTFDAWTSNPNGNSDNGPSNDAASTSFTSASNGVTLTIILDNYPEETSWQVLDGSTVLAVGGTYGSQPDGSTVVENICLPDGCFDFVINDAYGDGICCGYGNGSYVLRDDSDNSILASGGQFGSSETTNFCVQSADPLAVSISSSSDASCFGGNNGSATASASGGATPYSYSWSNGSTGVTVSGLTAGTYTVTVTDGNSDQAQANVTISQPSLLSASASGADADCNGGPTGSATASASGGVSPYSYSWSNGASTAVVNGLLAGSYSVTITDDNGCSDVAFVTIGNLPDSDNDGVCDADDQCPGSDDGLIGTACDDGDPCTTGDVYDANCGCSGVFTDSDSDGVCDAEDQCPGSDDALIGTACDDGDACTTGDVYDANCGCSGTFTDGDGDGVCDAEDQCPGYNDALIGTPCDDGSACTINDVYDNNCGCSGTLLDSDNDGVCDADDQCPGQDDALIGTACDDGDPCTTGDVYDANCGCSGTFTDGDGDGICDAEDQCPGYNDALIGTPCDDGNVCTINDVYDNNCGCSGTLLDSDNDGVCDADDQCPGSDDALIGTACDDGDPCTTGDVYDANCGCSGTFADADNDGVCDANDQCPGSDDALIGTACDDGDECTENDVYDANCGCSGTPIEGCGGCTYAVINSNDFESGWGIWNDGGSDCALVSNSAYANSGTYFIQLRDNSGAASSATTDNLNLSAYSELNISFSYYARSMDSSNEDFWLQISTNGGSSFATIEEWNRGDEFENNQRYNESVVYAGTFTSNTQLRFRCDASGNSDWVYIDDVTISGCQGGPVLPTCNDGIRNGDEEGVDCGGSSCAPCATCSDGIQNGDETGIDCGGSSCAPCNSGGCTYLGIDSNDFEGGWGIWNDGGSDCRINTQDAAYANSGVRCVRLRDNSGVSSSMTTDALDLSSYDEVTFEFVFIANSMENGEDFWLQYSTGGGYSTVANYVSGGSFTNGNYYQGTMVIPGPFTSNTTFRVLCDASANNDQVYIDDVVITGCKNGPSARLADPSLNETTIEEKADVSILSNVNLYPNPTDGRLNVEMELNQDADVEFMVIGMTGKTVFTQSTNKSEGLNKVTFDMNDVPSGIYMMNVITNQEVMTKRFVIQR